MSTLRTSIALALAVAGCGAAPERATDVAPPAPTASHDPNPALFAPDSAPYGDPMIRWAERWWQWGLSIPLELNPNDTATASPDIDQAGLVYYLPNPPPGGATSFTLGRDNAIAVLLSSVISDYPCPDPAFEPAPGQSLFDFLLAAAVAADNVAEITGTLDGVVLEDLARYYVTSKELMYFTGDPSLQVLDPCITGESQPAAIEAHFMMVKPLDPGTHVLTTRVVTKDGKVKERTATISVLPE
jgi:hypothetical protein